MDKETKRNTRLGIFFIVGLLLFIVGIFLIGAKQNMFSKSILVNVLFSNASGLEEGNYVYYNGVKVGVVEDVTLLNDSTVHVGMQIESKKRSFIRKMDVATISSEGLMGNKVINILPGEAKSSTVEDNDYIQSINPLDTDNLIRKLSLTGDNVNMITENLKKLSADLNEGHGTLQALIKDTVMSDDLQQSFKNIKLLTAGFTAFANSLEHVMDDVKTGKNSIGAILEDTTLAPGLEASISQLKTASDKLVSVADELSTTATMINSGDGVITKLLTDSAMAADLDTSMVNLKKSTESFNENMEALKHTWLLRGYYNKQEKEPEKK